MYTVDGIEIEVIEKTKNGYLVQNYYSDCDEFGNELEIAGSPYLIDKVFKSPPLIKQHHNIQEIKEKIDYEKQKLQKLHVEVVKHKAEVEEIQKEKQYWNNIPELNDVQAYLKGEMKYILEYSRCSFKLFELDETYNNREDRHDILSLSIVYKYNIHSGKKCELQLYKNCYRDGSGSYQPARLFKTFKEVQKFILKFLEDNDKLSMDVIVEACVKHKIDISLKLKDKIELGIVEYQQVIKKRKEERVARCNEQDKQITDKINILKNILSTKG